MSDEFLVISEVRSCGFHSRSDPFWRDADDADQHPSGRSNSRERLLKDSAVVKVPMIYLLHIHTLVYSHRTRMSVIFVQKAAVRGE